MVEDKFIFWEELNNKDYSKLFPESIEGKVILWLYNKIEEEKEISREFLMSDINKAIQLVKPIRSRMQHQDNIDIVDKLSKYFIKYNGYTETYSLRIHAITFGELAYETLKNNFKPTRIQTVCSELRRTLEEHIKSNSFVIWKEFQLDKNRNEFNLQIENLDNKLDRLISELRVRRTEELDFLGLLNLIVDKLELIKHQYDQLESAFRETDKIKSLLATFLQKEGNEEVLVKRHIEESVSFFNEIRMSLEGINSRINKIQPLIRQQISIFSRLGFASRTDKFFQYVMEQSDIKNGKVIFPQKINSFLLHSIAPTFVALKPWEAPPPIIPRQKSVENSDKKEESLTKIHNRLHLLKKVNELVKEFHKELLIKRVMYISMYFAKIFESNWGNFGLAVRFSYLIIKRYSTDKDWKLEVLQQKIVFETQKSSVELWEMKIFQRSLNS